MEKKYKAIQAVICCIISDISCCVPTKLSSMHGSVKLPSSGYNRYHYSYLCKLSPDKNKMQPFQPRPSQTGRDDQKGQAFAFLSRSKR